MSRDCPCPAGPWVQCATKKTPLDEFAKEFGEKKAARLLEILISVKDAEPVLDSSAMKATYKLDEPVGGKDSISFVRIDKYWYLSN